MHRQALLSAVFAAMSHGSSPTSMQTIYQANQAYMDSSRGKGQNKGPSIAMRTQHTNPKYPIPHQGAKECTRRVKQGTAGICYDRIQLKNTALI